MKVLIRGVSCSGKSTLARKMANELGLRHIELDEIYWQPGWQCLDMESLAQALKSNLSKDNWIVDGNYSKLRQYIILNYDTIVWLDYPMYIVIWRCLKRTLRRILSQQIVCNGNRETFPGLFRKESSMLFWVLKTFESRRRELKQLQESEHNLIIIRTRSEEKHCLTQLREQLKMGYS